MGGPSFPPPHRSAIRSIAALTFSGAAFAWAIDRCHTAASGAAKRATILELDETNRKELADSIAAMLAWPGQ